MSKRKIIKIVISVLIAALTALGAAMALRRSCKRRKPFLLRRFEEAVRGENHFSYDASKKL